MTLDQCLNPLYVYRNRERMLPFLKKRSSNFIRNRPLKQFKNRHQGERCFIIGNGPSLRFAVNVTGAKTLYPDAVERPAPPATANVGSGARMLR